MISGEAEKVKYAGRKNEDLVEVIKFGELGGHGGGDERLLEGFIKAIKTGDSSYNLTSAEESLQSHLLAFAAEKSRLSGKIIDFQDYKSRCIIQNLTQERV